MAWQFSAGEILTAANLNAVTVPWNAVCQVKRASTQSITNTTPTAVTFNTTDLDPLNWHDGGGATPSRIIPTIAGWYSTTFVVNWGSDTDYTLLQCHVEKNGAGVTPNFVLTGPGRSGVNTQLGTVPLISLNGTTDYIELYVQQTNTSAAANTVDPIILVQLVYPT